ncbi:MAG: hypothetical protein WD824_18365 [Cyclobacteriaceae bacterium]
MKERYYIFTFVDVDGFVVKPKGLLRLETKDTLDGFATSDKAREWIENNGGRQTDYIVLQILRKP